ncbi:hypothetical protein HMPREF3223_02080 [Cutibacterium avidum]|nr:hypothetical protein HMPREF3223_02080 [Cutibacterium avidum]
MSAPALTQPSWGPHLVGEGGCGQLSLQHSWRTRKDGCALLDEMAAALHLFGRSTGDR